MKRQLINLTGKPIRFLTLPTLKADTDPLEMMQVRSSPSYAINGIPVFTGAWITTREVPPLPKPCRHCGGRTCRECDGFGFDRDAPLYIVSEEVRITHGNRRDFLSVNAAVNGAVISFRGSAR